MSYKEDALPLPVNYQRKENSTKLEDKRPLQKFVGEFSNEQHELGLRN